MGSLGSEKQNSSGEGLLAKAPKSAIGFEGAGGPLLVSLSLVLLVFFLALIAMSQFDQQRQEDAMGSLQGAFKPGRPNGVSDFTGQTGDVVSPRRTFQETLSDLFATEIPAAKVTQGGRADVTVVRFPVEALFLPQSAEIRPARLRFLDGIIAALSAAPQGVLFKVEILVATDYDSSKMNGADLSMVQMRIAHFAQVLTERGAVPRSFAVGAGEVTTRAGYSAEQILMIFRVVASGDGDGGNVE